MPDSEPPGRQQGNQGGGSVPVVQSLGWTPRSAGRGPAPPARRPPPRLQHVPPQYPPDMPGAVDGPPILMQNFHGHHRRHSSSLLPMMPPPPPPPIPPAEVVGSQDWSGPTNRNAASSTAPPAWLTGTYGARGPGSGGASDTPDFRPSNGATVRNISNGIGSSGEKRHSMVAETKSSLGGMGHDFPAAESHEAWCKKHIEAIEATIRGDALLPNVKKVMEALEFPVLNSHRESLRQIRKEKWATTERVRGSTQDLRKLEREFLRIDAHATHIDSKITRLRSYSEFIENDWQDNPEPSQDDEGKANGDGPVHATGDSLPASIASKPEKTADT